MLVCAGKYWLDEIHRRQRRMQNTEERKRLRLFKSFGNIFCHTLFVQMYLKTVSSDASNFLERAVWENFQVGAFLCCSFQWSLKNEFSCQFIQNPELLHKKNACVC